MELTLLDRLLLPGIFPKEGNMKELIIRKDLKKKIVFTQEELTKYGIDFKGEQILWNQEGAEAKFKYKFSDLEKAEVVSALTKMDEEKKLTEEFMDLYDKFIKK